MNQEQLPTMEDLHIPHSLERHVVLVAPEVPWNTGNIGRTCLGAGACLHLIRPLGFSLGNRELKRAGLDYWHRVKVSIWENFDCFFEKMAPGPKEVALFTKNGLKDAMDMTVGLLERLPDIKKGEKMKHSIFGVGHQNIFAIFSDDECIKGEKKI